MPLLTTWKTSSSDSCFCFSAKKDEWSQVHQLYLKKTDFNCSFAVLLTLFKWVKKKKKKRKNQLSIKWRQQWQQKHITPLLPTVKVLKFVVSSTGLSAVICGSKCGIALATFFILWLRSNWCNISGDGEKKVWYWEKHSGCSVLSLRTSMCAVTNCLATDW